jgi:uncharacterized membrane protein
MDESTRTGIGDTAAPQPPPAAAEARWPMATAVLAATLLYVGMPHRGRVPGWWLGPVLQLLLLGLLIAHDPGRIDRRSASLQRLMVTLLVIMTTGTALAVVVLAWDILVAVRGVTATVLLGRGASIWVENVIVFSLWYWQLDRGGPAERAAGAPIPPSFAFPENATPELAPAGWRPAYPDYLYLAYTNATAFSPTDTLPVRRWAKLTMMVQSTLSLVIAILVIARAINVLPG